MVKRGRRKRLDPSLAAKYHHVALALGNSARDLCSVAEDGDLYGSIGERRPTPRWSEEPDEATHD